MMRTDNQMDNEAIIAEGQNYLRRLFKESLSEHEKRHCFLRNSAVAMFLFHLAALLCLGISGMPIDQQASITWWFAITMSFLASLIFYLSSSINLDHVKIFYQLRKTFKDVGKSQT